MAIVYLDFHKAFDVVSHTKLMLRLPYYGIRGSVLSWLKNFFTGSTRQTKIDNILSDSANLVSGVVQGSGVGQLMFLVYINELIELLDKIGVKVKAFADDVKIYVRIVNDIDSDVLQRALNSLQQWANTWQLIISVNKCCVLNIGNPRLAVNVNIGNSALPQPSSVLDLGITTTSNLSPSTHTRNIVCKANSRAIAIHRCFTRLVRAYKTYVRPLVDSNSVIWYPSAVGDIEITERVQRNFTKNWLACKALRIPNGLNA